MITGHMQAQLVEQSSANDPLLVQIQCKQKPIVTDFFNNYKKQSLLSSSHAIAGSNPVITLEVM
jgi:hypothetical protein